MSAAEPKWSQRCKGSAAVYNQKPVILLILSLCLMFHYREADAKLYSNQFAVHIPAGSNRADQIAEKHGFSNLGQIGSLENYFLFEHARLRKRSVDHSEEHHQLLTDEDDVHWFDQQVEKKRVKRDFSYFDGIGGSSGGVGVGSAYFGGTHLPYHQQQQQQSFGHQQSGFIDPLYKEQWYLTGGSKDGFDMNVLAAWKKGYTGKAVVVSILDDGIQTNHPDLKDNYDPRASIDINDNDSDPTPQDNGDNKHGTRCAGEVAAVAGNNICGVGVAYNASIGGVRMLDGTVNDVVEAKALGLNSDVIDIYSASWGPEDDGKTVDGPGPLARRAFIYGVTNGRGGRGSIFVWASGNGGRHVDSCNCDGYTNSIFTLSISSATQGGLKPWYLEECASTLATTYSSGTPTLDKSVATVDMDGKLRPDHICTVEHTGTSASAPLAAGIAALALEANRNLSWRDLQHLVVMTSRAGPLEKEEGWFVNGVGRKFSHKFGYGLMDAGAMVTLAEQWAGVPPQHICKSPEIREDREIPGAHQGKVKVVMDVDGCARTNSEIRYLEHVQCKISLRFFPRGNLRILLTSPMGTTSVLLFERPRDVSSSNFDDWPFLSVHFWGEQAHGRWTLEIINSGSRRINQPGLLKKWQLILYGTHENPVKVRGRSLEHPSERPTFRDASGEFQPSHGVPYQEGGGHALPSYIQSQEYLFPGASENVPQVKKTQMVRSQCAIKNEYWVRDLSICVNGCPEGYYAEETKKECYTCSARCKSCYNSTSCTACEHNLVLFQTSCMAVCPDGHFEADSSCEPCKSDNCASCTSPLGTECVKCKQGWYLHKEDCVRQCPGGYRPGSGGECLACPTGCHSCDKSGCLVCSKGYTAEEDGSSCVLANPECPIGFYLDGKSECAACTVGGCLHCVGGDQCVECQNGFYVFEGQCLYGCKEGLFVAKNKKECQSCPRLCEKCSSTDQCTKCRRGGFLEGGKCLPHCSDGYYNDAGTCAECSQDCKTCIGPSGSADCVTCHPGYTLTKAGTCVSIAALAAPQYLNSSRDALSGECPDGSWLSQSNTCSPCHPSCSKCTGGMPYNCKKCVPPLRLDRGSSSCIECCQNTEDYNCCHCDSKRHTQSGSSNSFAHYTGECHYVSRRVSETDEQHFTPGGGLSDSTVLSFLWLSVFSVFVVFILILHRRRRNQRHQSVRNYDEDEDGSFEGLKTGSSLSSKSRYIPLSLDEDSASGCDDEELYNSDKIRFKGNNNSRNMHSSSNGNGLQNGRQMEDFDEYDDYEEVVAEGAPLVLKT